MHSVRGGRTAPRTSCSGPRRCGGLRGAEKAALRQPSCHTPQTETPPARGAGAGVRAWCDYSDGGHRLYYWQTRSGVEVDLVVCGAGAFQSLEVKNTARVRPEDMAGLKRFGEDFPESFRRLVYRGKERFVSDGILCEPCTDVLLQLKPGTFPD